MAKDILKELPNLVKEGVIGADTATRIEAHYAAQPNHSQSRILIIFSILGALLVSLGIILILAHNWDDLSRGVKTAIAFIPLLGGQLLCAYTLMKKEESVAWREACSTILFFAIGTSIALVAQIYNIPSSGGTFMLTWSLLGIPIAYIMRSSAASLLFLVTISNYGVTVGYEMSETPYIYWLSLILVVPHLIRVYRENPSSNFLTFHHWFIVGSVLSCLGTIGHASEEFYYLTYITGLGLIYNIGQLQQLRDLKLRINAYKVIGSLGTIALLFVASFGDVWKHMLDDFEFKAYPEAAYGALLISILAVGMFIFNHRKNLGQVSIMELTYLVFLIAFFVGQSNMLVAVIIVNVLILAIGINSMRIGLQRDHLGIVNYGLLITMGLILMRFVDIDMSFVIRGIAFIFAGISFFAVNAWIIKRRKQKKLENQPS
jgi:uncharacterized membrane protein